MKGRCVWLGSLAAILAAAWIGYVLFDRLARMEERIGDVGRQVARIGEDAGTARRAAEEASSRAETARQSARDAAAGREDARRTAARAEVSASLANADARELREELDRIERERQAEIDRLEEALGGVVDTERTAAGLVMTLGSDAIEFDFDEAGLRPSERELLSRIAGVLLTARGFKVFVYGHTDDVGTAAYNQALSERRANAVRGYLVEAGIDPGIIEARGYGKSSPRASGDTPEARSRNRRVEIGVVDVFLDYPDEDR